MTEFLCSPWQSVGTQRGLIQRENITCNSLLQLRSCFYSPSDHEKTEDCVIPLYGESRFSFRGKKDNLRIPGMGEPGGLPSVGSHRVGHDWSDLAAASFIRPIPHEILILFSWQAFKIFMNYLLHLQLGKPHKNIWILGFSWTIINSRNRNSFPCIPTWERLVGTTVPFQGRYAPHFPSSPHSSFCSYMLLTPQL